MKKLLNTLYVMSENGYLGLDGETIVIQDGSAKDNDFGVFGSSIVFTRLEDITLLRAEALCALNRSTEAVSYLNMIRTNRGLREVSFQNIASFGGTDIERTGKSFEDADEIKSTTSLSAI